MAKKDTDLAIKVREIYGALFPHWTEEEILMHPREEGQYFVRMVNHRLKTQMDSYTIVGLLIGARKQGKSSGTRHTPTKLKEEIKALNVSMTYDEFREKLAGEFTDYCKSRAHEWTDEQLFRRFRESIMFCDLVREHLRNPNLPDMVIIRTLLNIRKSPKARRVES